MSTTKFYIHPKLSQCNFFPKESFIIDINVTKQQEIDGCEIVKCNKCSLYSKSQGDDGINLKYDKSSI